jgi:hypothetical protein
MDYEIIIENLYEFMKSECNNKTHTGKAIYYCLKSGCNKKYLCSECLIEDVEHFTNHLKTLVPLDDKLKFWKFLDLGDLNNITNNDREIRDQVKEIYSQIKYKCMTYIEEHMENYLDKYVNRLEHHITKDISNSPNDINQTIQNFINSNKKENFNELYDELNNFISIKKDNILKRNKSNIQINERFIKYKINDIFTEQFCKSDLQQPLVTLAEEAESEFDRSYISIKEEIMETLNTSNSVMITDGNKSQSIKNRLYDLQQRLGKIQL